MNATEKAMNEIDKLYWDRVDELAAKVLRDIVAPYCNRTQREFCSGMGSWSFHKGDRNWGCWDNYKGLPSSLVNALSVKLIGNHSMDLGAYIGSYKPGDKL